MSKGFTSRVLLVTVIPVVTTALVLSTILISGRLDEFNTRITERGQNLVNYLAPISEYGIFSNNFGYMDTTFHLAMDSPDIAAVFITNDKNNVIKTVTNPLWEITDLDNLTDDFRLFSAVIYRTEAEIDDLIHSQDHAHSSNSIGHVKLIMSLKKSTTKKQQIIKDGMFITLISTIATILVALLFSRSVIRPIRQINDGVIAIKEGNLSYRIPIDRKGELSDLAHGINDMSTSLEVAQIKEKQRAEDALFIEKTKAQITLEAIGEGVITTDINGLITYLNPAAEYLTGFSLRNAVSKPLSNIFVTKESASDEMVDYPILDCIVNGNKIHHESAYILIRNDNTEYVIRETASPLIDKENNVIGAVLVFHDITNIKKMSDVLTYQATHDDLTNLLNRRAFESKLNSMIANMEEEENHSLCYIDLDQFKIVNDTCGHIAGDHLLRKIAEMIKKRIRKIDLFARLGGDEFGLALFDCNIDKAIAICESIKEEISKLIFSWEGHKFKVGCSIGLVPITRTSHLTDIMIAVDTACYIAKDKGRNLIHVYNIDDDIVSKKKGELQWFQRINQSLDNNSFELYSQKIVSYSNKTNNPIHEILIRMNDNNGIILPSTFIPAAERYSIMPEVDKWVIQSLFDKIKNNHSQVNDLVFSVNLSGQSLTNEKFMTFLNNQLEQTNISPESLIFEITETSAISNIIAAVEFINFFKERGCKFALDDFGSGMCSFHYLNELPVDFLKIDGNFVRSINDNPFNKSIIESISQIGHSLGLKIIAEFVEDQSILEQLEKMQIDYIQGYGIDAPKPIEELFS